MINFKDIEQSCSKLGGIYEIPQVNNIINKSLGDERKLSDRFEPKCTPLILSVKSDYKFLPDKDNLRAGIEYTDLGHRGDRNIFPSSI